MRFRSLGGVVLAVAIAAIAGCAGDAGTSGVVHPNGATGSDQGSHSGSWASNIAVTSLVPTSGPPASGTFVVVSGRGFRPGAIVLFDNAAATGITWLSEYGLSCYTPTLSAGWKTVTVRNGDGTTAVLANAYAVTGSPSSPGSGTTGGGAAPGGPAGTGGTTGAGGGTSGTTGTTTGTGSTGSSPAPTPAPAPVPQPTITSLSPASGLLTGGTLVTVTGSAFAVGAAVWLDASPATNVTVQSSTTIVMRTPAHTPGWKTATVVNPSGQQGVLSTAFRVLCHPLPAAGGGSGSGTGIAITSLSPSAGPANSWTTVTITGTGFASGGTVWVACQPLRFPYVWHRGSTTLEVYLPTGTTGLADITVENPDGLTATMLGGFAYTAPIAPVISSVDPAGGTASGGTSVTVWGTGITPGAGITFGGVAATGVVHPTPAQRSAPLRWVNGTVLHGVRCTTPAGSAGAADVVVTNPDGTSGTLSGGFTYGAAPTISSISMTTGPANYWTFLQIQGTGFAQGASVSFGSQTLTGLSVTVYGATQISTSAPPGMVGPVNVTVTNPDGTRAIATGGFTYTADAPPRIGRVEPDAGVVGGGTLVDLWVAGVRPGATVQFGGVSATGLVHTTLSNLYHNLSSLPDGTVISRLQCRTPVGIAGAVPITITNPDGNTVTAASGFTYGAGGLGITSVSPSVGASNEWTAVTITGHGFAPGASVRAGGQLIQRYAVWRRGTTQLTLYVPPGSGGAVPLEVTNPDGLQHLAPAAFSQGAATAMRVRNVTPSSGLLGGGTTLQIWGTGILPGATITIGGAAATGVVHTTAGNLNSRLSSFPDGTVASLTTCVVPAGALGAADIVVTNTDGSSVRLLGAYTYSTGSTSVGE